MRTDLLLKLAGMLEADAANPQGMTFDLQEVAIYLGPAEIEWKPGIDCATTGCAMGLAVLSGEFPDLTYERYYPGSRDIVPIYKGRRVCYDDAACYVFDIDLDDARFLFSPGSYPATHRTGGFGERAVAARIRQLVKVGHFEPEEIVSMD